MRISDWSSDVCASDLKVTDIEFGIRSDFQAGDVKIRLNASPFVGGYSGVEVPISGLNTQATCSTTAPGGTDAPLSPDGDCTAANDPAGGTLLVNAGKQRVAGIDFNGRIAPRSEARRGGTECGSKWRTQGAPD